MLLGERVNHVFDEDIRMIIREVMMLPSYTNGLEKGVFFWPQPKVISWVQFSGPKTGNARGADGNARTPLAL